MKRTAPVRSADVARFRLGVHGAAIALGDTDPAIRRIRYEARRDLHDNHGEGSPLELWRAPCK